jgi:hypothetical protein
MEKHDIDNARSIMSDKAVFIPSPLPRTEAASVVKEQRKPSSEDLLNDSLLPFKYNRKYKPIALLGNGAQGCVYSVKKVVNGKIVALKLRKFYDKETSEEIENEVTNHTY